MEQQLFIPTNIVEYPYQKLSFPYIKNRRYSINIVAPVTIEVFPKELEQVSCKGAPLRYLLASKFTLVRSGG